MLTLPNYQIGSQIYESVNSLVYRGHRKKDNQPVILKVLKEDYPTPAELSRYRQEYEIMPDLELTGVINVYGLEKYQNTLVIILEDFGGESLKQFVTTRPLVVKTFLPIAIQIAESLSNIHAAHIIHKDINPSNIVVNVDTKQLKIIDFGIASLLARENPTLKNPEQLEGTLAYLSPEQTGRINRSMDYRTDLYSLGVTCYELLTGFLPFTTADAMELVHCHLAKTPVPVCEVNPNVPPIVSDIVMKLMAKNAEDRYQSAFGVKADLESCLALTKKVFGNKLFSTHFQLAQKDFSGKLQIPQKLYGRDNEVNTLLQAFERVCQGKTEMMLIAGYSGVGKTALVREVHKPMTEKLGYFAAGKFDQLQKNMPYFALSQAFNDFCRYLLMENAETLANWQRQILAAVGKNGQIIIDVIPDLELIIGPQPAVAKVGPSEAQNRFLMFFLSFVNVLCDKDHPFILFIDDLQWADSASLGLLKSMMLDDEIRHLFIIGAYRDNEVDSSHPFMMAVDELEKANAGINTIELANLQPEDVNQLLQDTLSCETALTQPLTDLIYQKTQGNAFFTHQFLHALYAEALLRFEKHQWRWDVEQIAAQNITANVVELMAKKIDKLPAKTSRVLQFSACIGNQFDLSILAIIYEQDQNETLSVLWDAIKEGLVQPLDENYKRLEVDEKATFKFLHDRVQQAAYARIDDEQKQAVHLQIGRLLLKNTPADALEEKVFDIVVHFNHNLELINESAEQLQVARLNLLAGKKAKMATAYGVSVNYFTKGRECLTETSWETEYDLTITLFTEATEAAYLNGDFKEMVQLAQRVLQQARSLTDEVKVYELQIQSAIAKNQMLTAIEIGQQVLEKLGIFLSDSPPPDLPIETFYQLPEMSAADKLVAMQIAMALFSPTYIATPQQVPPLVFTMVTLCLNEGNSPLAAFAYVLYGLLLCSGLGDIERGYQFGQLALSLLEKFHAINIKCRVDNLFNIIIRHWKEHARHAIKAFPHGIQLGLETGEIEYTAYNAMVYCENSCLIGEQLDLVSQKQRAYVELIQKIKQEFQLYGARIATQFVLNLRGQAVNPLRLDGEFLREPEITSLPQNANHATILFRFYFAKTILSYLLKDHKNAMTSVQLAKKYAYSLAGTLPFAHIHFYESLVLLAHYQVTESQAPEPVLKQVLDNQNQLKIWAKHAPMNFQHQYALVAAEEARILGQNWQAAEWFEKAIIGAKENQYLHEEALAYELAAEFYLGRGMDKFAQTYLREAHYAYQQWGALAKVNHLETQYPQFMAPKTTRAMKAEVTILGTRMASTSTKGDSEWLDLNSIMKAAQALSGEIVLSRLLEKMMHIVIENAGAESGFLLLPQQKQWAIEAEGHVDRDEIKVLQSISVDNQPIAETIIHYVARTKENVVLNNAGVEGQFTHDAHIISQRPQSVLCVPLVNQGKLTGILYLENNLTTGAFTPNRLEVLTVLSSQLAISIENALLYRTLEQRVADRTAQLGQRTEQLAQANQEITALNEQLKSDNLRMSAELDVSRQLQQMLLPKDEELEAIDGLDIAGFMEPADEVGGDYYDVLFQDGRVLIGIGDVTGHGLESGALAIMVQSTVRALLASYQELDSVKFLTALNQMVYHNVQRMNADKNLTLALLSYQDGQFCLTGQHEEMIVVRQGELELIDTMNLGFYIGLEQDISAFINQVTVSLNPGDVVVLYTDGITEAINADKQEYRLERLCQVVKQNWQQTAQQIQQAVIDDVRQFIGEQKVFDDITLLVLKQQ